MAHTVRYSKNMEIILEKKNEFFYSETQSK